MSLPQFDSLLLSDPCPRCGETMARIAALGGIDHIERVVRAYERASTEELHGQYVRIVEEVK